MLNDNDYRYRQKGVVSMSSFLKPTDLLIEECMKDIRWEFLQIRSQIKSDETRGLAQSLLNRTPLDWPTALLELQKGKTLNRLLDHINFHMRRHGLSPQIQLVIKGPFPALSLRPLQSLVDEYRCTLRSTGCIEFLGNKVWDYALKPVKRSLVPFKIDVATLALNTFGCSSKEQLDRALVDLSQRIKGYIINFLCEWEAFLIQQVREQLLVCTTDLYHPNSEVAV